MESMILWKQQYTTSTTPHSFVVLFILAIVVTSKAVSESRINDIGKLLSIESDPWVYLSAEWF